MQTGSPVHTMPVDLQRMLSCNNVTNGDILNKMLSYHRETALQGAL